MIVSDVDLDAIQSHWVIALIDDEDRKRAFELAAKRLANCAAGCEFGFEFQDSEASDKRKKENRLLSKVALAHEIAAIEGLDTLCLPDSGDDPSSKQSAAASYNLFDIKRLTGIPKDTDERIFHVLKLSALACCGGREADLWQWFEENPSAIEIPSVADESWDRRLFYRLFDCWIRLLSKKGSDDLERVREIVASLRKEQSLYEEAYLAKKSSSGTQTMALRLVYFYHWARATEIIAEYRLQGQPRTAFAEIDKNFESGIKAARFSGDREHEMNLLWLNAAGRVMITYSSWWEM